MPPFITHRNCAFCYRRVLYLYFLRFIINVTFRLYLHHLKIYKISSISYTFQVFCIFLHINYN
nr:MAG TPA: hypothetical protein [Bacteriophage sp.]